MGADVACHEILSTTNDTSPAPAPRVHCCFTMELSTGVVHSSRGRVRVAVASKRILVATIVSKMLATK